MSDNTLETLAARRDEIEARLKALRLERSAMMEFIIKPIEQETATLEQELAQVELEAQAWLVDAVMRVAEDASDGH